MYEHLRDKDVPPAPHIPSFNDDIKGSSITSSRYRHGLGWRQGRSQGLLLATIRSLVGVIEKAGVNASPGTTEPLAAPFPLTSLTRLYFWICDVHTVRWKLADRCASRV